MALLIYENAGLAGESLVSLECLVQIAINFRKLPLPACNLNLAIFLQDFINITLVCFQPLQFILLAKKLFTKNVLLYHVTKGGNSYRNYLVRLACSSVCFLIQQTLATYFFKFLCNLRENVALC